MASIVSSSPLFMTVPAATVQQSKLNATRASAVSGLWMAQKIQLKVAAKRSSSSCFKTKCSIALPETLGIVQSTIAKQLSIDASTVTPHTKFADLGADSLDTVEIMMALEEKFGVTVGDGGAENISTVQDAADLIEKVKAEAA